VFSFLLKAKEPYAKVLLIPSIVVAFLDPVWGVPSVTIACFPPRGLVVLA
jgi:hypothetical protein